MWRFFIFLKSKKYLKLEYLQKYCRIAYSDTYTLNKLLKMEPMTQSLHIYTTSIYNNWYFKVDQLFTNCVLTPLFYPHSGKCRKRLFTTIWDRKADPVSENSRSFFVNSTWLGKSMDVVPSFKYFSFGGIGQKFLASGCIQYIFQYVYFMCSKKSVFNLWHTISKHDVCLKYSLLKMINATNKAR